jgi:hypothetical protein
VDYCVHSAKWVALRGNDACFAQKDLASTQAVDERLQSVSNVVCGRLQSFHHVTEWEVAFGLLEVCPQ